MIGLTILLGVTDSVTSSPSGNTSSFAITTLLGGLAAGGVLAMGWGWIKLAAARVLSYIFVQIQLGNPGASQAFQAYCWANMKRSRFGPRQYDATHEFVRPVGRFWHIGYELVGAEPVLFWKGWRPMLCAFAMGKDQSYATTVTYLRGTFNFEAMYLKALELYSNRSPSVSRARRFHVHRCFGSGGRKRQDENQPGQGQRPGQNQPDQTGVWRTGQFRLLGWSPDDLGTEVCSASPFDVLSYPQEIMELVAEAHRWRTSEKWFKERQLPWRRGWLLHGKPGTGKTSLVRAIAQQEDMPVYVFDLASMSNREFVDAWRKMLAQVPAIALIEDIDATFDKRTNKLGEDGGGLTFDCLLNTIGGIDSADGVFLVITTNHIESLDEALGLASHGRGMESRPGRIDRVIEVGVLDEICRRRIAQRVLQDSPWEIERVVAEGRGDTGAQFQERCSRLALANFWNTHGPVLHKIDPAAQPEAPSASGSPQPTEARRAAAP